MKKLNFLLLLSAILIFTFMNSCTEEDTPEPDKTEQGDGEQQDDDGDDNKDDGTEDNDETDDDDDDAQEPFEPVIITVEAETVDLVEDWKLRTDIEGFTGDGYIIWEGPDLFWKGNPGGVAQLSYEIDVPKAGTYQFNWRSQIGKGDKWDEHNDTWLKLPDADDFFAQRDASIVYPKGSGKTPNPQGENGNGFFKLYMNKTTWEFTAGTSDGNFHSIYATFDEPGKYTIIIAPRSSYHAIDSFKLTLQE
ncbi:carbohydrate-binding protein [Saccharicrinis aurantiacus]|uniref:hypothetical protein n=1 Tax=Saccharicrinis aurantiacus TaxID=1849719 RepID=UPI0009500C30|nr:hypothetical protein [Saccharicrinis aurantiacus]